MDPENSPELPPFLAAMAWAVAQAQEAPKTVQKSFPVPSIGRVVLFRTFEAYHDPVLYPAIIMDVAQPAEPFGQVKLWVMRDSGPMILWAYYSLDGAGWSWPPYVAPVVLEVPE